MSLIHKLEGQVAVDIYSFEDMEGKAADGILKDETGRPGLWRGRVVCDGVGSVCVSACVAKRARRQALPVPGGIEDEVRLLPYAFLPLPDLLDNFQSFLIRK